MLKLFSNPESKWKAFVGVGFVAVVLDQISKYLAVKHLTFAMESASSFSERLDAFLWTKHPVAGPAVAVIEEFWHHRYVQNPGAAWGFLAGVDSDFRQPFFVIVSLAAMIFIIQMFRKSLDTQPLLRLGLAMVSGGAIGNLIDRTRLSYVIDFIDWHWLKGGPSWPTFNIADAFISVGVGFLVLDMILESKRAHVSTSDTPAPADGTQKS